MNHILVKFKICQPAKSGLMDEINNSNKISVTFQ